MVLAVVVIMVLVVVVVAVAVAVWKGAVAVKVGVGVGVAVAVGRGQRRGWEDGSGGRSSRIDETIMVEGTKLTWAAQVGERGSRNGNGVE